VQQEAARSNVSVSIKTFCFSPALFHITFVPIGVGVASISAGLHDERWSKTSVASSFQVSVGGE
jgi:cytochrome bd-type quinol oxidase subunit 1